MTIMLVLQDLMLRAIDQIDKFLHPNQEHRPAGFSSLFDNVQVGANPMDLRRSIIQKKANILAETLTVSIHPLIDSLA